MDFDGLRARVKYNLNRYDQSTLTSELDYWLNAECRRWHERAVVASAGRPLPPHAWSFLLDTETITLADGTAYYAAPADLLRPVRLTFTVEDAPVRCVLRPLPYLQEKWLGAEEAAPTAGHSEFGIDRLNSRLYIFPVPDDTYTGTLWYLGSYTDLVQGTDTNYFTVHYWDGIVAGATSEGLLALKQYEPAGVWRQRADTELQGAILADSEGEGEQDTSLVMQTDEDADAQEPRPVWGDEEVPPWE